MKTIVINNIYKEAVLRQKGHLGEAVREGGYVSFVHPWTPEVEDILNTFSEPQDVNLFEYVNCLRRTQDELRRVKAEGGRGNAGSSRL